MRRCRVQIITFVGPPPLYTCRSGNDRVEEFVSFLRLNYLDLRNNAISVAIYFLPHLRLRFKTVRLLHEDVFIYLIRDVSR